MSLSKKLASSLANSGGGGYAEDFISYSQTTDSSFDTAVAVISADGASDDDDNNTFYDVASGVEITNGDAVSHGSVSPYSEDSGYWSMCTSREKYADHVTLPNFSDALWNQSQFTIEVWIKLNNNSTFNQWISSWGNSNFIPQSWAFGVVNGAGSISHAQSTATNQRGMLDATTDMRDGEWHHLAATKNGTTFRIFTDGVLEGTVTENFTSAMPDIPIYLGEQGPGSFNRGSRSTGGYLSNLRISDVDRYGGSNFTPPTTPYTSDSNTRLLTLQDGTYKDNGPNNYRIGTCESSSPFKEPALVPTSPFDRKTTVYNPQTEGASFGLTRTNSYLLFEDSNQFDFGTGDFCVEYWFNSKTSAATTYAAHMSDADVDAAETGSAWIAYNHASYSKKVTFHRVGIGDPFLESTNEICSDSWNHVVLTRSGTRFRLFVNGVLEATDTSSSSVDFGRASSDNTLDGTLLFNSSDSGTDSKMLMSDFRVTKGSIPSAYQTSSTTVDSSIFTPPTSPVSATGSNVKMALDRNRFVDFTRHNLVESYNCAANTSVTKYNSASIEFNGTDSYLNIIGDEEFDFGNEDFTIEFWINFKSLGLTAITDPRSQDFESVPLIWVKATNVLYYFVDGVDRIVGTTTLSTGTWYHVAVVRYNGTTTLYLNGSSEGSWTDGTYYSRPANGFLIGKRFTAGPYALDGYIDGIRITRDARYTGSFTPPTTRFGNKDS